MPKAFGFDPDSKKNYDFDWSSWLLPGDTIQSNTIIISSEKLKEDETKRVETATKTTIWLYGDGLTVGERHTVTNRIETTSGLIEDKIMTFTIKEDTKN